MNCPNEVADALLDILRVAVLGIRNHAAAGNADRCLIEADHVHNLPALIRSFEHELLEFYWTTEREAYVRQSSAHDIESYAAPWRRLAPHVQISTNQSKVPQPG